MLAYVVANAAIVVMLLLPVHTIVIDSVSDVVLANSDTHVGVTDFVSDVVQVVLVKLILV